MWNSGIARLNWRREFMDNPFKQSNVWMSAFYASGSSGSYGNLFFEQFVQYFANQVNSHWAPRFYAQNDELTAIKDLLEALDSNDDKVIEASDIEDFTLLIFGYGWGGATAVDFSQNLNRLNTEIVVGGSPKKPISYSLKVAIPVPILFTVDVNPFMDPPGAVPNNVILLWNIYQNRGGDSIFDPIDPNKQAVTLGTPLSRVVKGIELEIEEPHDPATGRGTVALQLNFTKSTIAHKGFPFGLSAGEYMLNSNRCGHDGITFLATPEISKLMKTYSERTKARI
jgi:hypothetical protein